MPCTVYVSKYCDGSIERKHKEKQYNSIDRHVYLPALSKYKHVLIKLHIRGEGWWIPEVAARYTAPLLSNTVLSVRICNVPRKMELEQRKILNNKTTYSCCSKMFYHRFNQLHDTKFRSVFHSISFRLSAKHLMHSVKLQ